MNIEKAVHQALAQACATLPSFISNEIDLNPIITVENDMVIVHLCVGFPSAWLQEHFLPPLQASLEQAYPEYRFFITLDQFIKAHQTQMIGKGLRHIKNTIAIASGKGGVGKSTVTVNLAAALAASGARVGILDADIYGPSIPLMLGKTAPIEVSGESYLPANAHGIQAMSMGYLTHGEPALMWRGPMLAKSLLQMINLTQWDELDYLLIDLPPGTGDIQLSLVQKIPLTAAVIVTTPQTVATLDAEKALKMFERTNIDVLGIVENMSLHVCTQCGHQEAIFSEGGAEMLCSTYHTKLLGQIPLDSRIRSHCDIGEPIALNRSNEVASAFMQAALAMTVALSKKPLNYANKFPDIVVE